MLGSNTGLEKSVENAENNFFRALFLSTQLSTFTEESFDLKAF